MNYIDYIFIAIAVVGLVVGLWKGLIKQVLGIVGVIVVAALTATVEPYVQNWLVNTSMSEGTRNVVAMLGAVVLLSVAYSLLALLIGKLLKKVKIINALDRILGAVVGVATVYFVFAVVFALFTNTGDSFLPLLKSKLGDSITNSWVVTHIYKNNFFGKWIINDIAHKLIDGLQQGNESDALATLVALFA